jgi:hypothetical protein
MSENSEEKSDQSNSFKVSDRRKFAADGSPIIGAEADTGVPGSASSEASELGNKEGRGSAGQENPPDAPTGEPGKIDFSSFVLSLATSAIAHMGEVPDPATGQKTENLDAAEQMIDILSVLQEKTKGNLEADEDRLLDNLLYELRMKFLDKKKVISL